MWINLSTDRYKAIITASKLWKKKTLDRDL